VNACKLLGHRWRFSAEGETMRWWCERGCDAGGWKRYASAEDAARYARAFDKRDSEAVGRRPILALWPLGLARRARRGRTR
jgi:hypothetical protein